MAQFKQQFSFVSWPVRLFFGLVCLFLLTLPLVLGPFGPTWGAMFLGLAVVDGTVLHTYMDSHAHCLAMALCFVLPSIALHSRSAFRKHALSGDVDQCLHPTVWKSSQSGVLEKPVLTIF